MSEQAQNYVALNQVLTEVLGKICAFSDCQCVAIRLHNNGDYPYFVHRGFPDFFVVKENSLCTKDDEGNIILDEDDIPLLECMCGNVLKGRVDTKLPHFTKKGSFWTNSTTKLLASATEKDLLTRTRNMCNFSGYESVALIPIRSGSKTLGLIQMNDPREDLFTLQNIIDYEFLAERVASVIIGAFEIQDKLNGIFQLINQFKRA